MKTTPIQIVVGLVLTLASVQAQTFTAIKSFGSSSNITGRIPYSTLVQGHDGTLCGTAAPADERVADGMPAKPRASIPWSQLGAKAGADYKGDGLAMTPTESGARLQCVFQRLESEATPGGLWLTSTVTNRMTERFRVKATAVGRGTPCAPTFSNETSGGQRAAGPAATLPATGTVHIADKLVRFIRPGLLEEYSVSMDGVRQDFVVLEKPVPPLNSQPSTTNSPWGALRVELEVTGANVESAAYGAQLVLPKSGRKIAYSRLRVTDANGKELPARMEVLQNSALRTPHSAVGLAVVVNDTGAVYPVRIDPTFSDINWISMNPSIPGADIAINAAVVDGLGNLYIGGFFIVVGNTIANRVAKWDGSSWSALGSGLDNPFGRTYVDALAMSGGTLYVGGVFTTAGGNAATNIAQWNGTSWSALGSGVDGDGEVAALAVLGGTLYAGGYFTTAGGSAATNIAQWNGSSWSPLGLGLGGGYSGVNALAVSGSNLYAGGNFTTAGGNNIAQWDGSSWSALGSGMDRYGYVNALAVSGGDLYAGGYFTTAGGVPANYIAMWDGSSWSALGDGMGGGGSHAPAVLALAVSGSDVYAGGWFTTADGMAANGMAKWDGNTWTALGQGISGATHGIVGPFINALAVSGSNVFAGGEFTMAGDSAANYVAKWDGSNWSALGSGLNGPAVQALALSGSDLYVGGDFTTAGATVTNHIAKWDGGSWSALGSGISGALPNGLRPSVRALAVSGADVYAGGYFTNASGIAANSIAKWNGSAWSALGSGLQWGLQSGEVYALAVSGSNLYAGGLFATAGGVPAFYIAKWDGNTWSALGSGLSSVVSALAVSGSNLYAGGQFTTAGGVPANYIAKWDGSTWSALGSGLNGGVVNALAVSGSDLYAGGSFTNAGGVSASYIAKWNGSSWTALGSGIGVFYPGYVNALAVSGSDLYAGGSFTTAGGIAANSIAKWDGSNWSALGSGMGGTGPYVYALAVSGSDLYAGGDFSTAGGKVSPYLARAIVNPPFLAIEPDGFGGYFLSFSGVPGSPYRLQRAQVLTGPWATSSAQIAPTSGYLQFWDIFPPPGQAFYRTVGQ